MNDTTTTQSTRIARLNDQFRRHAGILNFGNALPGLIVCTSAIAALPPAIRMAIWEQVRNFHAFSEDNDPYGEHDFGAFDMEGAGKIFWKMDYYADSSMEFGSEDPSDPTQSYRILTVMLAEEY